MVKNKYVIYNVANIITFGTLLTKQVLRDTGRILKMSTTKIDRIVKRALKLNFIVQSSAL